MKIPNSNISNVFKASGKTQQEFCREQGISIHALRYYLYKRNRRKDTASSNHNHGKTGAALPSQSAPSFISFNRETFGRSPDTTRHTVTIIHGSYTLKDVAEFLSTMAVRP